MESDKCFFATCWLYEEVLITWVERHSLVPPCPAVSSLVTIVLTVFLFRLASAFPASLTFCLQGTVSLVPLARTIDEPLYQFWMRCFCVDLIFGETGLSLLLTKFAALSAKKCICCWPCHFALLKQHSFRVSGLCCADLLKMQFEENNLFLCIVMVVPT